MKLESKIGESKMTEEKEIKVPILTQIQNELKAPKNQYNSFGKYKYRNAEDIEQALKPLLAKYGASLVFDEDYREVGGRVYAVEIAHYKDSEQEITVKGWAREATSKKGMDDSQVSGSTSSYATKYALGKLFLIDDTKDSDSVDNSQPSYQPPRKTYSKNREALNKKIESARNFKVQYGGQQETLVSIIKLANSGDDQATKFLGYWREKSRQNEAVYQFIIKEHLA